MARAIPALPSDFNGDGVEDLAVAAPWDTPYGPQGIGTVHIVYSNNGTTTRPPNQYLGVNTPGIDGLLRQYPSMFGYRLASGDFDRDGYADLAVTVPGFDEPDPDLQRINVGGVVVIYGTSSGLEPLGTQRARVFSQDSPGVPGVSEDDDAFGSALAAGDFDGDGYADLAIGAAGETFGPDAKGAGSMTVLYGAASGVTARDQWLTQDTPGILDVVESRDYAARSLVAGDFNSDGADDLVIGVADEGVSGRSNAGAVNVVYGKVGQGLTVVGDRFLNQASDHMPGVPQFSDRFGATLAVGDFDGDHHDDLVIGAPEDSVRDMSGEQNSEAGTATVIYGTSAGLAVYTSRSFSAMMFPFAEGATTRLGASLAAGDVDADGYDELAVGSPMYGDREGRVDVIKGGPDGLGLTAVQTLDTTSFAAGAVIPGQETFGTSLAFGAFDTDPGADLAIGIPRADLRFDGIRRNQAGAAVVTFSRDGSLATAGSRWLTQAAAGIAGSPGEWEMFGYSLPGSTDYNSL